MHTYNSVISFSDTDSWAIQLISSYSKFTIYFESN